MIVKIVCAGKNDFSQLYKKDEDEVFIGVDGGSKVILKERLPLFVSIGDFDSASLKSIQEKCKKVISFPREKNESDLELALKYVASTEFLDIVSLRTPVKKIIIYNATGKRLDHYQAALNVLIRYMHLPIEIIDRTNLIQIVNSRTHFKNKGYKYFSFFAIDDNTIISLKGFKYELDKYHLKLYDNLCLSNEIAQDEGILYTNNKKIMVIQSN